MKHIAAEVFVESLRGAIKSSWGLRFGQFLLFLANKHRRPGLSWLAHVPDEELEEMVRSENLLHLPADTPNKSIAKHHESSGNTGGPVPQAGYSGFPQPLRRLLRGTPGGA